MREALALAADAAAHDEVPVGAVVVHDGKIIGRGQNARHVGGVATAHAELLAIEEACRSLGTWRLDGCTLYVTMECCPMCAGAVVNSRIGEVVFGCRDTFAGCLGSVMNFRAYPFSHAFRVVEGVMRDECAALLKDFFKEKRK